MTSMELAALSGVEAQRLLSEGKITALELTDACLARIAERQITRPGVGFLDPEPRPRPGQALRRDAATRPAPGPLHGIPVGIKDIIDTRDMPTENGTADARRAPADQGRRGDRAVARRGR